MKRMKLLVACLAGALAVAGAAAIAANPPQKTGSLVLPQDKGPDKVDVADYPANIQQDYRVFDKQCGKCHTLARPVNTSMPATYWANYMGGIMKKGGYGITLDEADKIYEFLAYDQAVRKTNHPKGHYPAHTEDELEALKEKQGVK